jgi:hypothetical protein
VTSKLTGWLWARRLQRHGGSAADIPLGRSEENLRVPCRIPPRVVASLIAAGLVACGGERATPATTGRADVPVADPARHAGTCPARDFAAFFAAFSDDSAVQARHTRFPLERVTVVDAAPEPRDSVERVGRAQLRLPLVPPAARRAADSLHLRIEPRAGGELLVVLERPNTDYQLAYVFEPAGACWELVRTEDRSL